MRPDEELPEIPEEYAEFFEEELEQRRRTQQKKKRPSYSVIHEDERVIVVDKVSGIATIPERYEGAVSLKELLDEQYGKVWTVHRIDKDTSGVVVFAKDADAHRMLNQQFQDRETIKKYAVFLEGEMQQEEITIDIPLVTDTRQAGRMRPSAKGKESLTVLRIRELFRGFTYAEAQPKTGRQHQIRVHCKAIGLPLLVDPLYGNHEQFLLSSIKKKYRDYGKEERPLVDRLTLHAEELTVKHPGTGESVTYSAPLPKDLNALLTQLQKLRKVKSEG